MPVAPGAADKLATRIFPLVQPNSTKGFLATVAMHTMQSLWPKLMVWIGLKRLDPAALLSSFHSSKAPP